MGSSNKTPQLGADDAERYHRPRRPVEVRRRSSWRQVLRIAARVIAVGLGVALLGGAVFVSYTFATSTSPVFRLASLDDVEVLNAVHASPEAVRERFAGDIGSMTLSIPLEARRASVEEIPWVEAATVQRVLPHSLRVYVRERTPVAFLRQGASLWLVDRYGVLLPTPEGTAYSFPVVVGLSEGLTLEERRERVALYLELTEDLNRDGSDYARELSEVDLSDPENVRASVTASDGVVWLYFGRGRYREKFETFQRYRPQWQDSPEPVHAVDLRFRGQIVLNPAAAPAQKR
ncbi:MAG TPA: FtsQ-type POTRA domain-containing protein [Candidatus Acidoferrales bacterium]|nr:FtsQ-type POTRA domain-containing protein [Candidatus Acidoferrales bacterium]